MAELAVNATLISAEDVFRFLKQNLNFKETLLEEVDDIRTWLSRMQAYLKDMEDTDGNAMLKDKVKLIRKIAYDIEDTLDEFMLRLPPVQNCKHPHFEKFRQQFKTLWSWSQLHKVSSDIQRLKRKIEGIKGLDDLSRSAIGSLERGSSSGCFNGHQIMHALDDDEIIGFAKPKEELIQRLMNEDSRCLTISLVGPGGSGKSFLVKNVYGSKHIKERFDCHAWVRVSQSFKLVDRDRLLFSMLNQFCASREDFIPNDGLDTQEKLRCYLQEKRYLLFLDDIWRQEHWDWIKDALPSSSFGSRIIVTTQRSDLTFSRYHYMVNLPCLTWEEAWYLFCKNAFRNGHGKCPRELIDCSERIVKKCEGLPLAIVEVGGLLSRKPQFPNEWEKVHNSVIYGVSTISSTILLPSYKDLPSHLRNCFLYLSIFPEDSSIERERLIRLWIAERFVMEERRKTLEQVAENYLNELIGRNLILVSSRDFDGRVKTCRVPNHILDFIVDKSKEENFSAVLTEPIRIPSENVRRLSALSVFTDVSPLKMITSVRSIFLSRWEKKSFREIAKAIGEFKFLRVLDLQGAPLDQFPEDISHLTLLRYLSLRDTRIQAVPVSIEKLLHLETLDLKQTYVSKLPKQISNLHNLRHLLVYHYRTTPYVTFDSVQGAKFFDGIGGLTNLQKLSMVNAEDHLDVIKELSALTELRKLGLTHLRRKDGKELCTSIQQMQNLTTLDVSSNTKEEYLDLVHMARHPRQLQRLYLKGRLKEFPVWISSLHNLFRISLKWSRLEVNPLEPLQHLANLVVLEMVDAYTGAELEFEAGNFKKLKSLHIEQFYSLHTVLIQEGSLPQLQKLTLCKCDNLKMLPWGINYLNRIEQLLHYAMPVEFIAQLQKTNCNRVVVSHIPLIQ